MRAVPVPGRRVGFLLLALLAAAVTAVQPSAAAGLEGPVIKVVDGDTIYVRLCWGIEKIRYIGVNAPEVHHPTRGVEPGGREAAAVNRGLLAGKHVRLELDVQQRDRYGRLLAYVWINDLMVNAELVRLGYAQVMTVPPNVRYQERFLRLQRDAREFSFGEGLDGQIQDGRGSGRPLQTSPSAPGATGVAPAEPALERR